MKLLTSLFIAMMFVLTGADGTSEAVTVTGKLIDTKCYGMNHMNVDNEHVVPMEDGTMGKLPNCATACAQMGIPVGILEGGEADGQVYILVTPAPQLAEHAAKDARVVGDLAYPGGIIPTKLEVKNADGEWEEVHLATMM
ncbi:MAG: hypothetical protein WD021_01450 [Rhodothermales bacterium]